MARELHPQGIHVAHNVIDGGIKSARRAEPPDQPASLLDPDAIAATYLHVIHQPRSAWSSEVALRPWLENSKKSGFAAVTIFCKSSNHRLAFHGNIRHESLRERCPNPS